MNLKNLGLSQNNQAQPGEIVFWRGTVWRNQDDWVVGGGDIGPVDLANIALGLATGEVFCIEQDSRIVALVRPKEILIAKSVTGDPLRLNKFSVIGVLIQEVDADEMGSFMPPKLAQVQAELQIAPQLSL